MRENGVTDLSLKEETNRQRFSDALAEGRATNENGVYVDNQSPADLERKGAFMILRQTMDSEDGASYNPNHVPHDIGPDEMLSIIEGMDDPAYIIQQKNGRYAEVIRYYDGKKKHDAYAVFDFANDKNSDLLNGYPGGTYNTMVTAFDPENLQKYIHDNGNIIIYEKTKSAADRGSDRSWSSHISAAPFADVSVTQAEESVNSHSERRYSLNPVIPVEPTSTSWERGATFDEVKAAHPTLYDLTADENKTRNPTQVTVTTKTYRKIYDILKSEGFNGTILDASSGLGIGTNVGRTEYGYNIEDIEPYRERSQRQGYGDNRRKNQYAGRRPIRQLYRRSIGCTNEQWHERATK